MEGTTSQPSNINDNIYTEGNVGIGTQNMSTPFKVDLDGNSTDVHTISFSKPGSPSLGSPTTGIVFNESNSGNHSRFDLVNQPDATSTSRYFGLKFSGTYEPGLYIRKGGNVGVGTPGPDKKLVVFENNQDYDDVTSLLSLVKITSYPASVVPGMGVGIEFKATPQGQILISKI